MLQFHWLFAIILFIVSTGDKSTRKSRSSVLSFRSSQSFSANPSQAKLMKKENDWIIPSVDKIENIYFKTGNVYTGETSKWLMHGKGTYTWSDGTCYEGQFVNGLVDGKGKMILPDLSTYEGDFKKNFLHGNGVFSISCTPSVYKGSWENGMKHGQGWFLYEKDNWYEGEWFENKRHGNGFRRYKSGAKYKGMWSDDKKNGEGSMVWENNDLYTGQWKNDQRHGYGEYTWKTIFPKYFLFPYSNWYKGRWANGIRAGAGVMNFGTECGATLAGTWESNMKHGPGLMICGNGIVKQCNPLFLNDKPVHMNFVGMPVSEDDPEGQEQESQKYQDQQMHQQDMNETQIYREILKQISSKTPQKKLNPSILQIITQNGIKRDRQLFIEEDHEGRSASMQNYHFCPLFIPIHTRPEMVDLIFFINTFWHFYFPDELDICEKDEFLRLSEDDAETTEHFSKLSKIKEQRMLQNSITLHLPKLTEIYDQYATIMADEKHIKRKVILIRLFLWQLLRDAELPMKGISLNDVDEFLAKNPRSCLESDHYPFEPIYFWQFIEALVGCAWLFHLSKKTNEPVFCGIMTHIFNEFIENHIYTCAGRFKGTCLTQHKDLLPIKCVYDLYLKIGESMTVFDFIYFTCTNNGQPICYVLIEDEEKKPNTIKNGNNVTAAAKLIYLEEKEELCSRVNRNITEAAPEDPFYKTLFTFRNLGRKKIIALLRKVCSFSITRAKHHLDYKLTFLEFYETLLLCAWKKVEEKRKMDSILTKRLSSVVESKTRPSPSTSKHVRKKRKGS